MVGDWITGAEIEQEYHFSPIELGKVCFSGQITAYAVIEWGTIYEASKLPSVPKYPPVGVDRMDHQQSGEDTRWDWDSLLGIDSLRAGAAAIKACLPQAIAVWKAKDTRPIFDRKFPGNYCPFCPVDVESIPSYVDTGSLSQSRSEKTPSQRVTTRPYRTDNYFKVYPFEYLDVFIQKAIQRHMDITAQINSKTGVPPLALVEAEEDCKKTGLSGVELYEYTYSYAWKILMPRLHYWIIDGSLVEPSELEGRTFFFNFDMFRRYFKKIYENPSVEYIIGSYQQAVKAMWFKKEDIEFIIEDVKSPHRRVNIQQPTESEPLLPSSKDTSGMALHAQGGSRPETDKINATNKACGNIENAILQGTHLDRNGKIGVKEFVPLVEDSMKASGFGGLFQKTAAANYFKSSNKLIVYKRGRGEKQ